MGSCFTWLDAWVDEYNHRRPHSSIGMVPPVERFARRTSPARVPAISEAADRTGDAWIGRRAGANGVISVSWQQICLGKAAAGHQVDVHVSEQVLQIWDGNQLLKTVPRSSRGEVRKKRALDHHDRGLISNQSVNELAKPARQASTGPEQRLREPPSDLRRGGLVGPPSGAPHAGWVTVGHQSLSVLSDWPVGLPRGIVPRFARQVGGTVVGGQGDNAVSSRTGVGEVGASGRGVPAAVPGTSRGSSVAAERRLPLEATEADVRQERGSEDEGHASGGVLGAQEARDRKPGHVDAGHCP